MFVFVVGNVFEWYDFFLYSIVVVFVFGELFFLKGIDLFVGMFVVFVGFFVGFVVCLLGGVLFGYIGDCYG